MPAAIEIEHLTKRYKNASAAAVDDISFAVPEGEFFAFLGPNGAGKTTTVSVLTTTLAKTSGRVRIAGHDLDTEAHKIRAKIGVIFQSPSLDQNLTAEENIRLHACLYNLYPYRPFYRMMAKSYRDRVGQLASLLGIKDAIFDPIKTLSGGMKRKLEIVRGLMHQPTILFLDEPTTGLDPQSRRALWTYLQDMRNTTSMTIFLTTHYLEEAEQADHIAIISRGKIVSFGTPAGIKKDMIDEYVLLDSGDRDRLAADLRPLGVELKGRPPFKIDIRRGNGATAQKIISSVTVPLTVLDIHRPTLEEAYLEIVEGRQENMAASRDAEDTED